MSQTFILHANDAGRERVVKSLQRFLETLPANQPFKIEIGRYQKRRSDQQNRYLWGVVYAAFKAALPGWDAEDIHEFLLGEHFGWERMEGMGRPRMRPIKRSSQLTKQEFGEYVDFCIRKGAEHGVFVPEPEPDA